MRPIYLDNNATTPLLPAVMAAMQPHLTEGFGNPASAHTFGRHARRALEDARDCVASLLGALPEEVIFTSGGTESNNLALFGLAGHPPAQVIISAIEHPSVAEPAARLAERGFTITRLPVDRCGLVKTDALADLLQSQTRLVAVMMVNHETGAIQPVAELVGQLPAGVAFHCDAVQAVGKVPVDFHDLGVTTLSLSAHKFHGPKGVGALLARRGTQLQPTTWGGHQQQGRRPGTESVALAVGLAKALELAQHEQQGRRERVRRLRSLFLDRLCADAGPVIVNGSDDPALDSPYTLNVSFPGCQADALLMNVDLAGVACSTGSACSSGSLLPSPVLQAMSVAAEILHSAMRFSFSALSTEEEVIEAAGRVIVVVKRLRECDGGDGMTR